jgi:hypothetical protein
MKNKQRVIVTMMMLMLVSCQTDKYEQEYERFSAYMKEVHHVKKADDGLYIVLPVVACNACNEELIEALSTHRHYHVYIIITSLLKSEAAAYKKRLIGYPVFHDTKEVLHKRGIASRSHPVFIEVSGKQIKQIITINYAKNMKASLNVLNRYTNNDI